LRCPRYGGLWSEDDGVPQRVAVAVQEKDIDLTEAAPLVACFIETEAFGCAVCCGAGFPYIAREITVVNVEPGLFGAAYSFDGSTDAQTAVVPGDGAVQDGRSVGQVKGRRVRGGGGTGTGRGGSSGRF